jgi:single-strand DNA-binding protein
MAIQTQQAFSGFIASDPQLSRTENGDARLYMKVGKEHYRQEEDGSFTQLETTFHHLVAFKAAAEQGADRLAKGDKIVAEGYVREYRYQDANGQNVEGEEFIARRLGHDLARTRYEVDRSSRRSSGRESVAFGTPEARTATQAATVSM